MEGKNRGCAQIVLAVLGALLIGLGAGYSMAPRSVTGASASDQLKIPGHTVNLALAAGATPDVNQFVIGGLLNPTLVLGKGAKVTVYFRNIDPDTRHSMIVIRQGPPYAALASFVPAFPGAETGNVSTGIPPGASVAFSFVAGDSGTYWYVCGVAGHAANGMYGELIVQG